MSKTKKILSIVLAVVMAFGVFSICAFADTDTATWTIEVTNTDGSALPATIPTGTVVKVTVKLQTNFYVGTVGLPVYFSDAFSYVDGSAVQADIYGAGATRKGFNDDYTADTGYEAVYAVYVPNSSAGATSPMYSTATTVLTFNLTADSEAAAEVFLDATKQKTASNLGGPFYCGSRASADVTTDEATVGQTFAVPSVPVEVVIADVAATPELVGINGGVKDDTNMYVYGVPAGDDANDYFTVNNGSMTVSASVTGGTLTVYDSNNTVYATYTVIIFGDVNGDGSVTLADTGAITRALMGDGLSGVAAVAADANGSGSPSAPDVTLADTGVITRALMGDGYSVANPYAA